MSKRLYRLNTELINKQLCFGEFPSKDSVAIIGMYHFSFSPPKGKMKTVQGNG